MTTRYRTLLEKFKRDDDAEFAADVRAVMRTPEGRRLFMAALAKLGVYRASRPDDNLAYLAGRRDAGLELLQAVNHHALAFADEASRERNKTLALRNEQLREAAEADKQQQQQER